ncbi:hypothetical protein AYO38_06635 [bacterium SCGC AG-212-C10]|nr:hypothetical protein AYO38_06635 [bacterium SCGC AG-212-C10]
MHTDQGTTAFRFLIALGELWDGLHRAGIDPRRNGVHLTKEYLGGYTRMSAGPGSHARLVFEWHESSHKIRVLRDEAWAGFEASVSATVKHVREEARARGIIDVVDEAFVRACKPQKIEVKGPRSAGPTAAVAAR